MGLCGTRVETLREGPRFLSMFVWGPCLCGEPSSYSHLRAALMVVCLVHPTIVSGVRIVGYGSGSGSGLIQVNVGLGFGLQLD